MIYCLKYFYLFVSYKYVIDFCIQILYKDNLIIVHIGLYSNILAEDYYNFIYSQVGSSNRIENLSIAAYAYICFKILPANLKKTLPIF